MQGEHAEADERVTEEDCCAKNHQYEKDMDFLAEVRVGKSDGKINCQDRGEKDP